jgi:hypothetical protein
MAQHCRPMRGDATRAVHGVEGEPCVSTRAYATQGRHTKLPLQNAQFCHSSALSQMPPCHAYVHSTYTLGAWC